ncbi:MAG: 50S ribosomal protein L3 [Gammaproteobacteria bacterium RIFCSPLOWO2_02_FULL_56_15]|nr:MAG: 50S ribosomal protein L3 [Gammaproteobacteria bacterium RIFCSPLOWO2_02_FULL_56_15]
MSIGIVGRKCGMTRIFTDEGQSIPVTVIEATPNKVLRLKDPENDGYRSVQVAWGSKRKNLINRPDAGVLASGEIDTAEGLIEFRLDGSEAEQVSVGSEIKVDIFQTGQRVDVTGTSIGKGFAGVIKRHNFRHQRNSHGNSLSHRAPGSIGQNQTPGKVMKGKKMAGHMGNVKRTIQNLEVIRVDADRHFLLVKGAVPGSKGGKLIVMTSVKAK